MKGANVAASIRQRLLTLAHSKNWEFNRVLARYGVERILFRLAASEHRERFILKGATLFTVWEGAPHRATKDLDLLGLRKRTPDELADVFRSIIASPVDADGLVFTEVAAEPIRAAFETGGVRITLHAELAAARIDVQVDVGFGDAIVPPPVDVEFPTLLNSEKPRLKAYSPETVIAEKFEAMVRLGIANSRMKDFFDIWRLLKTTTLHGEILAAAMRATLDARHTELPSGEITALTPSFFQDPSKQTQWKAFLRQAVPHESNDLTSVVEFIRVFLVPIIESVRLSTAFNRRWHPKTGWE